MSLTTTVSFLTQLQQLKKQNKTVIKYKFTKFTVTKYVFLND